MVVEEEQKKKGLFKSSFIPTIVGFVFFFIITVSFIINTGSSIALFAVILLVFLYCGSKFFNDFMNAGFETIGRFVLTLFIFGLISFGFCMLPTLFY